MLESARAEKYSRRELGNGESVKVLSIPLPVAAAIDTPARLQIKLFDSPKPCRVPRQMR